jgi:prepilin-type N-terminal cleavage/methylation domain-containing protein
MKCAARQFNAGGDRCVASGRVRMRLHKAFTLIEIMVVVGLMGILLAMGIPSILKVLKREGMRKAVNDVIEVCGNARARAIFSGTETEVVFYPLERRFQVSGGGGVRRAEDSEGEASPPAADSGLAAELPESISIEMLDINLLEYRESETARVRFFPNGTSDELTLILRSDKNEWRKIWLEVTTGLADWENIR